MIKCCDSCRSQMLKFVLRNPSNCLYLKVTISTACWIGILDKIAGRIISEGFRILVGKGWRYWTTSDRLLIGQTDIFVEMNPANDYKKYPVSVFVGDVYDPNG